jgi:hypothetical protein
MPLIANIFWPGVPVCDERSLRVRIWGAAFCFVLKLAENDHCNYFVFHIFHIEFLAKIVNFD